MRIEHLIVSLIIMLAVLLAVLLLAGNIVPDFAQSLQNILSRFGPAK